MGLPKPSHIHDEGKQWIAITEIQQIRRCSGRLHALLSVVLSQDKSETRRDDTLDTATKSRDKREDISRYLEKGFS